MELVQNNICMVQQRGRSVVMRRTVTVPVVTFRNARRFLEEHASGLKGWGSRFLWNVGIRLQHYLLSQTRRAKS